MECLRFAHRKTGNTSFFMVSSGRFCSRPNLDKHWMPKNLKFEIHPRSEAHDCGIKAKEIDL